MHLEEEIQHLFIEQRWTLSTAESCTGGSLAARLTRLSGASRYFLGGLVAYSNLLKMQLLQIPAALIQEKGAVSGEVVALMAANILNMTNSDFSIAVSGIAGPTGGTPEKPIGTVWGAIGRRGYPPHVWKFHIPGNRQAVIEKTIEILLSELLKVSRLGLKDQ
jgi:PncC family amidohydrolase